MAPFQGPHKSIKYTHIQNKIHIYIARTIKKVCEM